MTCQAARLRRRDIGRGRATLAQDKVVNVYNWSDYIDPAILEDFTKETGIKVVYDTYRFQRGPRNQAAGRQDRL